MRKTIPTSITAALFGATVVFASPAQAATIPIIANDVSVAACQTAIPSGSRCFFHDNKITAAKSGNSVIAINPITANVGDTISITNQAGVHNMIFCKAGTVVNGWTCGDPITSGGADPGNPGASTAGAPSMIGEGASSYGAESNSTTLDSPGTYFFWCGVGQHRFGGQYGKLEVVGAQSAATTPSAATTVTTTAPTSNESASSAAPTLSLKKAGGKVTATGKATPGARVVLQKQVGKKWVTVASTKATAAGTYTIRANAEAKKTTYRVSAGSRSSLTRRL